MQTFRWILIVSLLETFAFASRIDSSLFNRTTEISGVKNIQTVTSVLYGNKEYGYFETKDFKVDGSTLKVDLIPPGYKSKINFFIRNGTGVNSRVAFARSEKWNDPIPKLLNGFNAVTVTGVPSWNFLARLGYLETEKYLKYSWLPASYFLKWFGPEWFDLNTPRTPILYILNFHNEIVWAQTLLDANGKPQKIISLVLKPLGPRKFGVISERLDSGSEFQILDTTEPSLPSKVVFPFDGFQVPTHDLAYRKGKIYTIGKKIQEVKLVPNLLPSWTTLVMGSTINEVDLERETMTEVFDSFSLFSPLQEPDWKGRAISHRNYQLPSLNEVRPLEMTHANSLHYNPGKGFLVFFRRLNKLVALDESFKFLWSMGYSRTNSFQVIEKEEAYFGPHSATLLDPKHILLFDNGLSKSRLVIMALEKESGLAVRARAFYPEPPIFSPNSGSAGQIENGNFFGYFPPRKEPSPSYFVDFDQYTGREISRLEFEKNLLPTSFSNWTVSTLGNEVYLGRGVLDEPRL